MVNYFLEDNEWWIFNIRSLGFFFQLRQPKIAVIDQFCTSKY
jgi:hypothetical protein